MKKRTWVILGATSIIAEEFAHLVAQEGHNLVLIGRQQAQLDIIAADMMLRHQIHCEVIVVDLAKRIDHLLKILELYKNIDLFIAHSLICNNDELTSSVIKNLVNVNITHTIQLIHCYWHKKQSEHRIVFLSSVAARRGRAKNSLYGASKAAIETYLEGLQQAALPHQHITVAKLGFIDTHVTYGEPGIFYASPPKTCAMACWQALRSNKRTLYHPAFWRFLMGMICSLPFFVFKRMKGV